MKFLSLRQLREGEDLQIEGPLLNLPSMQIFYSHKRFKKPKNIIFSFTKSVFDRTTKTLDLTSRKFSDLSRGVMRHIRTRDATTNKLIKSLYILQPLSKNVMPPPENLPTIQLDLPGLIS